MSASAPSCTSQVATVRDLGEDRADRAVSGVATHLHVTSLSLALPALDGLVTDLRARGT